MPWIFLGAALIATLLAVDTVRRGMHGGKSLRELMFQIAARDLVGITGFLGLFAYSTGRTDVSLVCAVIMVASIGIRLFATSRRS